MWYRGFVGGLLLAVAGEHLPAASWYVDKAAAGANNGTSWANAWTSFAAVAWGSSGVKAGDTLFISGGSTAKVYTEAWSVGASGAAGSPIRIAIDAANPSHNGVAIFDFDALGDAANVTAINCAHNYVTFDGNVNGACHLAISNLRNVVNRRGGTGIDAPGTTGVVFDHVASTNCNTPIRIEGGTAFKVTGCNLRQVRGNAAIGASGSRGSWDANVVSSNVLEMLWNMAVPPGGSGIYVGPDGVQCASGISIFGNTFVEHTTSVYTSDQHPDTVQATGNYIKIFANEFINVGDSVFDYDCFGSPTPHDVWIYNNLFRITNSIDEYPEYFRLYNSGSVPLVSLVNFKLLNNTFADNTYDYRVIRFDSYGGVPIASGNEIKNNLFYNCGGVNSSAPVIYIENSTGFDANSFAFDANIYYKAGGTPYIVFRGTAYTAANWVQAFEPHGKTSPPALANYIAPFAPGNDFHLKASDTVAKDAGLGLSAYFTTDKDFVLRPQGPAWDIGAYEYANVTGAPVLTIRRTGTNTVVVSWSAVWGNWVLQQTMTLTPPNWADAGVTPVNSGGVITVTLPATSATAFFRLRPP